MHEDSQSGTCWQRTVFCFLSLFISGSSSPALLHVPLREFCSVEMWTLLNNPSTPLYCFRNFPVPELHNHPAHHSLCHQEVFACLPHCFIRVWPVEPGGVKTVIYSSLQISLCVSTSIIVSVDLHGLFRFAHFIHISSRKPTHEHNK